MWYEPRFIPRFEMNHVICLQPGFSGTMKGCDFTSCRISVRNPIDFACQGRLKSRPTALVDCASPPGMFLVDHEAHESLHSMLRGFDFHAAVVHYGAERLEYWVVRCTHHFRSLCFKHVEPLFEGYLKLTGAVVAGLDVDKSDIWCGPGYKGDEHNSRLFISQRFVDLVNRNKWKYAHFTPLDELESHLETERAWLQLCPGADKS